MRFAPILAVCGAAFLLTGCAPEEKTPETAPTAAPTTAAVPAPPLPAPSGAPGAPMMGMGTTDPMAPVTATPEMDKKIAEAEKKGDKKAIAIAYTERGNTRQHDDKAGARTKYRAALKDFRAALKADPTNADAKNYKEQIESIYKSMGRPVPTD